MSKTKMMTALALALAAGGCMTDDTELETDTAELTSVGLPGMTVSTYTTLSLGGAGTNKQCFLATVEGDISTSVGQFIVAGAGVSRDASGNWELWARPASGSVRVKAMCGTGTSSAAANYVWNSGELTQIMKPTTGWRCMLTEISTTPNQFGGGGLHSDTDVVQITSSGGYWRLGGTVAGNVTAKARCIAYTADFGQLSVSAPANQTATVTTSIFDNTVGCALTAVTGHFDAEARGVDTGRTLFPSTSAYQWSLTATDGAGGSFRCIR